MDWLPIEANYTNQALRVDLARVPVGVHPLATAKCLTGEAEKLSQMSACTDADARSNLPLPAPSEFDPLSQRRNPQVGMIGGNAGQHNFPIHHWKMSKLGHLSDKLLENTLWQILKEKMLVISKSPVDGSRTISSGVGSFTLAEQPDLLLSRNDDDKYTQRLLSLEKKSPLSSQSPVGTSSAKKLEATVSYLTADLASAWKKDERVRSLGIAVQMAALLSDVSNISLYPTMFVRVTDELEKFGSLLRQRMQNKIREYSSAFSEVRVQGPCPSEVRELSFNWIKKTDSITSLLPGVYMKISLLFLHRFQPDPDYTVILAGITDSIRQIRDPLITVYAMAYLLYVTQSMSMPECSSEYIIDIAESTLLGFASKKNGDFQASFLPPLEWILHQTGLLCFNKNTEIDSIQWSFDYTEIIRDDSVKEKENKNVGINRSRVREENNPSGMKIFQRVVRTHIDHCNDVHVLSLIIRTFPGFLYTRKARSMIAIVESSASSSAAEYTHTEGTGSKRTDSMFRSTNSSHSERFNMCNGRTDAMTELGLQLTLYPPPLLERRSVLRDVWVVVSCTDSLDAYVRCVGAWMRFAKSHCSAKEVLVLLSDLANNLNSFVNTGRAGATDQSTYLHRNSTDQKYQGPYDIPEAVQRSTANILESLLSFSKCSRGQSNEPFRSFQSSSVDRSDEMLCVWVAVISSESFMTVLDTLKGSKKISVCQEVLERFKQHPPTDDAVLLNALFDIGRIVHDGADSLSPEGDRKYSSSLLCFLIGNIDCGRDLEKQLDLYCECRSRFRNLELVTEKLVQCGAALSYKTHALIKGNHSKKTLLFVQAALAYCHITVPSVHNLFVRCDLLIQCAECAMVNGCLPQTDTFLKAAISILPELPEFEDVGGELGGRPVPRENRESDLVKRLLSLLVVVPGHPRLGPFFILRGLMAAIDKVPWQKSTGVKIELYSNLLVLLCVLSQKSLPYHIRGLDSNDALFSGSAEYVLELHGLLDVCMRDLMVQLESCENKSVQNRCALTVLDHVVSRLQLTAPVCALSVTLLKYLSDNFALNVQRGLYGSVLLKVSKLARSYVVEEGGNDDVTELLSSISTLATLQMR